MELKKIFDKLDEKLEQGVTELPRLRIGEEGYSKLLSDITQTLDLMDKLRGGNKPQQPNNQNEVKVGADYVGLDGAEGTTRVVVFTRKECSFCEEMEPVMLPVLEKATIEVEYVDTTKGSGAGEELARHLALSGVPAFLFVKEGKVTHLHVGFDSSKSVKENQDNMLKLIKEHL